MSLSDVVVLSNRGPVSWRRDPDGTLRAHRGAGGLVTALVPALAANGGTWIAAALSESDAAAARDGRVADAVAHDVELLVVDDDEREAYLDVVANRFLWFAHHDLWNRPYAPSFDDEAWAAWNAYESVNRRFAEAAAEHAGPGATVLVQDYHLSLVPGLLRSMRPDVAVGHFSHTPFASPSSLAVLPPAWAVRIVSSLAAADLLGFHTHRWEQRFASCADELGVAVTARTGAFPLGPDTASLEADMASDGVAAAARALDVVIDGRRCVVRVDRAELSKNVLRGLDAFALLLERNPSFVDDVVHVVALNPSRGGLAAYRDYLAECRTAVDALNERFGREVVVCSVEDDYHRSIAALMRADVLVVNPIADGMNLVAKEGPLCNRRDAPLVLSTAAGAHEQLAPHCLSVHPYDVRGTADAMANALEMSPGERAERAAGLRAGAVVESPPDWLARQLDLLRR